MTIRTESETWTVPVGDATTTAIFDPSFVAGGRTVVVFGHGASSHLAHPTVTRFCEILRSVGLHTVRYNFLYTEHKKGPPDRMPRLTECLDSVVRSVREKIEPEHLLGGGHSMGGRVASMLAASGTPFDGLILCGYPLHPAGQPEKLRKDHLADISVPTLCCNGTRDELCTQEIMAPIVATLPRWTMHWFDHVDHSFHVRKKDGRTDEDVSKEFGLTVATWLAATGRRS